MSRGRSASRKAQRKVLPGFTATDKRRIVGMVLLVFAAAGLLAWFSREPGRQAAPVPPFLQGSELTGTLPATLAPDHFTDSAIRKAYTVASKMPRVLAQQPCYCWCSSRGHRSLLDCYRTEHAATCDICIKEALLAEQMHDAGKTPQQIPAAIVAGEWNQVR